MAPSNLCPQIPRGDLQLVRRAKTSDRLRTPCPSGPGTNALPCPAASVYVVKMPVMAITSWIYMVTLTLYANTTSLSTSLSYCGYLHGNNSSVATFTCSCCQCVNGSISGNHVHSICTFCCRHLYGDNFCHCTYPLSMRCYCNGCFCHCTYPLSMWCSCNWCVQLLLLGCVGAGVCKLWWCASPVSSFLSASLLIIWTRSVQLSSHILLYLRTITSHILLYLPTITSHILLYLHTIIDIPQHRCAVIPFL